MPKRKDLKKVLVIGSGPIIIGQACEFDYSGSQACRALRREGIEVVLINNNPATIMTDREVADKIYLEPLVPEMVEKVMVKEKVDAVLTTMGGQTGLNLTLELHENGILESLSVEPIGASIESIKIAEDRDLFKQRMKSSGLDIPVSRYVKSNQEAKNVVDELGFPVIMRLSFTLGGSGGSICYGREEFLRKVKLGLDLSPINTVLIEEFLEGWKEFELELMRDRRDNVVIVASIENIDPMGIHTGDSITVAPQQTLSDRDYQEMRSSAIKVMRKVGVDTGGSNVQFAMNPSNGKMKVIEMNPRVSRSSALASKATGFPIAKIAALLAVGYTLDEIENDITKETPASFEPALDYCAVKFPRWNFEKFPEAKREIGPQMQSVGEAMALGRNFKEALQKAVYSLESRTACSLWQLDSDEVSDRQIEKGLMPNPDRIFFVRLALAKGMTVDEIHKKTRIDPWFLNQIKEIADAERLLENKEMTHLEAKKIGFSDSHVQKITGVKPDIRKVYRAVDTCAGEFRAETPYFYSCYERENEAQVLDGRSVAIVGSGPNRIGQGIEFDYCCVHTAMALKKLGYRVIMINSNPETVSTDYDVSDRLYFEPLHEEFILEVLRNEKPGGVIIQVGGQTPLKLAKVIKENGFDILGTQPKVTEQAENREFFSKFLKSLNIRFPDYGTARSKEQAFKIARRLGYPLLVRPSYVLGGMAMGIVYNDRDMEEFLKRAFIVSPEHSVLIDRFLEDAFEYDVDGVSDGSETLMGGIMEQIEEAGIHSGDSACAVPPCMGKKKWFEEMKEITERISSKMNIVGLFNLQFAVKDDEVYVLEVNPRASRTIPYLSKTTGLPMVEIATRIMLGEKLKNIELPERKMDKYAIKQPVFSFEKFDIADSSLGPEMKSTGEVVGIGDSFGSGYARAFMGVFSRLPKSGSVLITVNDSDKPGVVPIARDLEKLGFDIYATRGTAEYLRKNNIRVKKVKKIHQGSPNPIEMVENKEVTLLINTPLGREAQYDDYEVRRTALENRIPYTTTISAARCLVEAITELKEDSLEVNSIQ